MVRPTPSGRPTPAGSLLDRDQVSLGNQVWIPTNPEVGSGPGDHTPFYLERGCTVVATGGRAECLQALRARYPQVETHPVDMNRPEPLRQLGTYDVVHCYGLLYHLDSPEAALAAMAEVCTGLLLLETCVSPGPGLHINPVNEIVGDYTQSVNGHACRPTRAWVFETMA